jgi:murein DD-endopeptidase MepM/ murein hydrolase activator NlpD
LKTIASVERALGTASERAGQFLSAHPRSISAALSLFLAGFAATAFGLAAPAVPDMAQRIVTEIVIPTDVPAQLETLAAHELSLYRSDLTRSSDTADSLLRRLGVLDAQAAAFLRTDPTARRALEGRAGKMAQARAGASGRLEELVVRFAATDPAQADTHFSRLRIVRFENRFRAALETAALETQVRLGSGTVTSSLFAATDDANLPDSVASQIAEMFATEIDFHRDLRRGDTFSVLYEARTADGEPIGWNAGAGRVLAAEFVNAGESHSAVWYEGESGKGAYFGFDGHSKQHAFLASPLEFSRVTSGFAMRMHPILNQWKQHKGVDYGAPTGTAVRTVGDGIVTFAGQQNGYGNVVELRHSNNRETVYAHLSRIGVKVGQQVTQGDVIGAVGATGWATGPHLHFEFKVDGTQQDPMAIAKSSETVAISPAVRPRFMAMAQTIRSQLDTATTVASSARVFE